MHLRRRKGIVYICERVKKDDKWGGKYLKSLGRIPIEEAKKELKRFEAQLEIKSIYKTIVIDPPWEIEKIPRQVRPRQKEMDYDTMSIEEIKKFPLRNFVSMDGSHVYLWATQKHLLDAFEVFKAWGITYHCLLTWIKNVGFTPYSWMYSTEFVLFGMQGNLSIIRKGVRVDFKGKVREHSRKPDEFYDIVKRVSPEPRIDIFSREKREGFDQWGNETTKFN